MLRMSGFFGLLREFSLAKTLKTIFFLWFNCLRID